MNTIPKAYSYIRFSTPEQERGEPSKPQSSGSVELDTPPFDPFIGN